MSSNKTIDINCDMGESYGRFIIGNDEAIFPYITSCNIACGFHGGDPYHIEKTISMAKDHGVNIGAHPSFPDLAGFGRRNMDINAEELTSIIKYQIAALYTLSQSMSHKITYVKPHGALYNMAAKNQKEALCVIQAIQAIDPSLYLMGLSGSPFKQLAENEGLTFIDEAFADRVYSDSGSLLSRTQRGSVIERPKQAADQVLSIINQEQVQSHSGKLIPMEAASICVHGDHKNAVAILQKIEATLSTHSIAKQSFA